MCFLLLGCVSGGSLDRFFPNYHTRPPQGWMNDPNGPFYDPKTSTYHLFAQFNPSGASFPADANISWAHAVSPTLSQWNWLKDLAIVAPNGFGGAWSGSTSINEDGDPVILYTCIQKEGNVQLQCRAIPSNRSDPLLTHWTTILPPFLSPSSNIVPTSFRDDTAAWYEDGKAWIAIGVGYTNSKGGIEVYSSTSSDFKTWKEEGTLYEDDTGLYPLFECPGIFRLKPSSTASSSSWNVGFKVSTNGVNGWWGDLGYVGRMEKQRIVDHAPPFPIDIHSGFYASKAFPDAQGERVLFGWIRETDPDAASRGWQGVMSVPRIIGYDEEMEVLSQIPHPDVFVHRKHTLVNISSLDASSGWIPLNVSDTSVVIDADVIIPSENGEMCNVGVFASANGSIQTTITVRTEAERPPQQNCLLNASTSLPLRTISNTSPSQCHDAMVADKRAFSFLHTPSSCTLFPTRLTPSPSTNTSCTSGASGAILVGTDTSRSGGPGSIAPEEYPFPGATKGNRLHLTIFVDNSVVEAFFGEILTATARAYPPEHATYIGLQGCSWEHVVISKMDA